MDKSDLKDAVASTLDWRQGKAAEFPDDSRNVEAVQILERLSGSLDEIDKAAWKFYGSLMWTPEVSEALSETLREVGFHRWPKDATALLSDLFQKLGRDGFQLRIPA
jgi:hypothetical protein